jgi:hypothetical protein
MLDTFVRPGCPSIARPPAFTAMSEQAERMAAAYTNYSRWVSEGRFAFAPTVIKGGVSAVLQALIDQLDRKFKGLVLVNLADG